MSKLHKQFCIRLLDQYLSTGYTLRAKLRTCQKTYDSAQNVVLSLYLKHHFGHYRTGFCSSLLKMTHLQFTQCKCSSIIYQFIIILSSIAQIATLGCASEPMYPCSIKIWQKIWFSISIYLRSTRYLSTTTLSKKHHSKVRSVIRIFEGTDILNIFIAAKVHGSWDRLLNRITEVRNTMHI